MDFKRFKIIGSAGVATPESVKKVTKNQEATKVVPTGSVRGDVVTLYNDGDAGGFKQWSCWIEEQENPNKTTYDFYFVTQWGHCGNKLQLKRKIMTSAYTAEGYMRKQIKLKRRNGYRDSK